MKKIILMILITLPITSHADYEIRKPLEANNGGYLTSGSIKFTTKDDIPPKIEYDITCRGIIGANASHWRNVPTLDNGFLYWNGALLASGVPNNQSYTTTEGIIYKRGQFIKNQGAFDWYELCQYVEKK